MSLDTITRVDGQVTVTVAGADVGADDGEMPSRIGRFFIFRQLGEGGMGRVFLGYDEELDRKLAIKLWHGARDHTMRVRVLREAQALARLSHPNVITVYEVGEEQGRVYLAMEYVEGETLRRWVEDKPRTPAAILARYVEAGRGLAAAHRAGILHRDFKPDNAIAGADDRVRVLDFGLARAERSLLADESLSDRPVLRVSSAGGVLDAPMTVVGTVIGTPAYMPPEQLAGETTDVRSDIFSFSVSLWEALYQVRPFRADSIKELSAKIERGEVDEGSGRRAVPRPLRTALLKGLAADPDDRWQSMDELLLALERGSRRLRWLPFVAVALVVIVIAVVALLAEDRRQDQTLALCREEAQAIDAVWNETVRADLRETARATDLRYATAAVKLLEPLLNDYARRWSEASLAICERSAGDDAWTPAMVEEARSCLEESSWAIEALVVELSQANLARLQQAQPAALSLPAIDRCLDPAWLDERPSPPSDPSSRIEIDALREAIERTHQLEALGKIDEAQRIAETLVKRADELGWRPLRARTRLLAGRLSEEQEIESAAQHLESGFFIALDADDEALAAELATRLIVAVGVDLGRPEEGRLWSRWARALIRRQAAGQEMRMALVDRQLGILASALGDLEEAEAAWRRSLAIHETILGPHHPDVAKLLNNIGTLYQRRDKYDEAAQLWERALEIWETSLGPDHATTAAVHVNLALVYRDRGQHEKALASTQRALALWERTLGPNHAKLVTALLNIGHIQNEQGQLEEALTSYARALEIAERTFGEDDARLEALLSGRAKVLGELGRTEAAAADLERMRASKAARDDIDGIAEADLRLALLFVSVDPERSRARLAQALVRLEALHGTQSDEVLDALVTVAEAQLDAALLDASQLDPPDGAKPDSPLGGAQPEQARKAHARKAQPGKAQPGTTQPDKAPADNAHSAASQSVTDNIRSAIALLERALRLTTSDPEGAEDSPAKTYETAPPDPVLELDRQRIADARLLLARALFASAPEPDLERIDALVRAAEALYLSLESPPEARLDELRPLRRMTEPAPTPPPEG